MNRDLDGYYFRVNRNEKWENICFSDLTEAEMREVLADKRKEFCVDLVIGIAQQLKFIGEEFDIVS